MKTQAIRQVAKPDGEITTGIFAQRELELPELADGEVLVRAGLISVDPYLVMRFRDASFPDGAVRSRLIGTVEQSRAPGIREGDTVLGFGEWQKRVVVPGQDLRVLAPRAPLPAYLGALGHSGYTALLGMNLLDVGPGQVFSVSSAAGMVGLVAGQLAKHAGARVIGIAGGVKTQAIVDQAGFDAGVDYLGEGLADRLASAAPLGIDRHFENVGASILDAVLSAANDHARIALCGLIAHYAGGDPVCFTQFERMMAKGIAITGFNIFHHLDAYADGLARLEELYLSGALRGFEVVTDGFDALPCAMVDMLAGKGFGKHMVKVG